MKTCRRLLEAAQADDREAEVVQLRRLMQVHLRDFEYVQHYPKHLPYNALFPAEDSEASRRRRGEIRKLIRSKVAQNGEDRVIDTLEEEDLDHRAMAAAAASVSAAITPTAVPKSSREKWQAKRDRKERSKARREQGFANAEEDVSHHTAIPNRKSKNLKTAEASDFTSEAVQETKEDRGVPQKKDKRFHKDKKEAGLEKGLEAENDGSNNLTRPAKRKVKRNKAQQDAA